MHVVICSQSHFNKKRQLLLKLLAHYDDDKDGSDTICDKTQDCLLIKNKYVYKRLNMSTMLKVFFT